MPEKTDLEKVAELLNVAILPPLDGKEAQSLNKALPGYQVTYLRKSGHGLFPKRPC